MANTIRPAERRDAADVVVLMDIAGYGADLAWWRRRGMTGGSALEAARRMVIEDPSLPYHITKVDLLEVDGAIAGMVVGSVIEPGNDHLPDAPAHLVPVLDLESEATGHWLVLAVALYTEHRGMRFADHLIDQAVMRCRAHRCPGLSVVTEDSNRGALALYRRHGFDVASHRPWIGWDDRQTGATSWLRLERRLPVGDD